MDEAPKVSRTGWWQKERLPDRTIGEKKISTLDAAKEVSDTSPQQIVPEEVTPSTEAVVETTSAVQQVEPKKVERERWTEQEQKLIFRGMRALQSKDKDGRRFHTVIRDVLKRENLVIDEMSFFRPYGPYSMMMPDIHQVMLNLVAEYRRLPESADMSKQEDVDRIEDLVKRAQLGDLSPNRFKELEVDIERLQSRLRTNAKLEEVPQGEEQISEDLETAGVVGKRIPVKRINRPWKEKWDKVQYKNKLKEKWTHDANREWSLFTERFMVFFTQKLLWGGEGTTAKIAAEYDDVFNKADGIVTMQRDFNGERVKQIYAFDTTDGAEYGIQKTADTLRFIDLAVLSTLEFAEISTDIDGNEMKGMRSLVPRLNYVISRPLAAEMALLLKNNRYDLLALHPAQLMVLKQAQAQVNAYLSYIETEYKDNTRRRDNKVKIIDAFVRLRDLIDAAVEEREAVLRETMEDLMRTQSKRELDANERDMLALLVQGSVLWSRGEANQYGELYDTEHGKYMRVFRPDRIEGNINNTDDQRTRAWWRLTALTEKYPAVITDDRTEKKVPVPSEDKRRGKRGKIRRAPRGANFLSKQKGEEKPESDISPNDGPETTTV